MNKNKTKHTNPDLKTIVRSLMNVEPSSIASLGAKSGAGGNIRAGLHEFMRAMLERSVGLLWAPDNYEVRLQNEAGARAMGYDAKTFNLLQIFALALVREPRRKRGLKDLVLREAHTNVVDLPRKTGTRSSVVELVAIASILFEPDFDAMRDAPGLAPGSVSVRALMSELLNVKPETLIRIYYDNQSDADKAFAKDPEGQTLAGLSAMLTRIVYHYSMIAGQNIDKISFLFATEHNYSDAEGAAAANLGAVLTLGLLEDGKRDLGFVA
ncbi:protein of unknown function [Beijerinckiaceae bacterium RH AL1]|nr:hypothetical protein [Beijerinckiaceae bacterium]VVB42609.1 protein of unknown function [Beijerinckiaceae bacterium RH AL8]VVB42614.1 protein of unknown function [Beijerinckiaceae bacterium RH CH11]VVC53405.1 protein of unknown function [Beijerinckiaceae bacterium RH AL1]